MCNIYFIKTCNSFFVLMNLDMLLFRRLVGSGFYLVVRFSLSTLEIMRVILVGFMGSGKTTLGKKIANRLEIPFIDSDAEIEAHFGKSISEIFVEFGESHFREIESEYIDALDLREEFVLATGGGMPCFANNMDRLNLLGTSFYLERSPKELTNRLMNAKAKRPLVEGMEDAELLQYVENTLLKREEYYQKAHITLSRSEQEPSQVVTFMHHLRQSQSQKS